MLINSNDLSTNELIETHICIMGGGVAGITLANELSEQFSDVVLLESGGEHYDQDSQNLYQANKYPSYYPDPSVSRLRFLGGASNHWANNTSPLSAIDFEKREWVPNSGWPINYQTFSPYYEKAAQYCQTGDDGYSNKIWLPKLKKESLLKGAQFSELAIAKASLPPTRFYASYGESLKNSNNVTVYTYANITNVEFEPSTQKINKAIFTNPKGKKFTVSASAFIMCFGGIENARMLLHFNAMNMNLLGNQHDNVGRYFMDHPTCNAAHIYSNNPELEGLSLTEKNRYIVSFFQLQDKALREHQTLNVRMPLSAASKYNMSNGISSYHVLQNSLSANATPDNFGTHLTNLVTDLSMVIEAVSRKSFDTKIFDSAEQNAGFEIPLMMEQTPDKDNQVTLSRKLDKYGIPKVNINWRLNSQDIDFLWKTLELVGRDLGALSLGRMRLLKERSSRLFGNQMGFGHHHMGTTRMAENETKGVVDSELKVFGTDNFYIGGSSVFPTGGHVPPTLTIVALSIRLADHLKGILPNE
jgi:choline dehydrogenase-like flavoprotein